MKKTAQSISNLTAIKSENAHQQNHHRNRWTAQGELLSKQIKRNSALWRREAKCMYAYHMSLMAASSSSRFMLLDSLSPTPSWTLIHCTSGCALSWRFDNINKSVNVDVIFAEKGSYHWKCESYDLQILCFYCSLSWLTHIAEAPCWSEICFPAGRSPEPTPYFILCLDFIIFKAIAMHDALNEIT